MAHNNFPNNRRLPLMTNQDNYEYELKKIMEQERRSMAAQVEIFIEIFI
jgi:hypothetical protein